MSEAEESSVEGNTEEDEPTEVGTFGHESGEGQNRRRAMAYETEETFEQRRKTKGGKMEAFLRRKGGSDEEGSPDKDHDCGSSRRSMF